MIAKDYPTIERYLYLGISRAKVSQLAKRLGFPTMSPKNGKEWCMRDLTGHRVYICRATPSHSHGSAFTVHGSEAGVLHFINSEV